MQEKLKKPHNEPPIEELPEDWNIVLLKEIANVKNQIENLKKSKTDE